MVLLKRVAALDDKNVRGYLNSRILPEAGGMPNPAVDLSMTVAEEQIEKHTVQMKVKHMVKTLSYRFDICWRIFTVDI